MTALVVAATLAVFGAVRWLDSGADPARATVEPGEATASVPDAAVGTGSTEQDTLLLVVAEEGMPATSITLLAGPADGGRASVVFIPTGTLAEIPGFGMERLGAALRFGGIDLVEASAENSLGLEVDHSVAITPELLADFLGRAGGLPVDVAGRVVDRPSEGDARVVFPAGPQTLDGQQAAEFWTFRAAAEDEVDSLRRQQQVWDSLLQRIAADEAVRGRVIADGVPQLRPHGLPDDEAGFVTQLLAGLLQAHDRDVIGFDLLPVEIFSAMGEQQTYRLRESDVDQLVAESLAPSRPGGLDERRLRVQVLNGVGTPGVGRSVDSRLDGEPVKVVLTDNAVNFDQRHTRILVYDETASTRAAAERVRERLGVGTIELSRQPQSVVDLTIVVGADFPPDARG